MKRYFHFLFILFFIINIYSVETASKTIAAVIDIQNREGVSNDVAGMISDYLRTQLFNTNKYIMVTRENMQAILREQNFQQSGCTSAECVVQMGKILGASKIFTGTLGKIGSIYLLDIKMIDVETGKIDKAKTAKVKGGQEGLLKAIDILVAQMAGIAPSNNEGTEIIPNTPKPRTVKKKKYRSVTFNTFSLGYGTSFTKSLKFTTSTNIYFADLGLTGTHSEPFTNLEFKDLKNKTNIQIAYQTMFCFFHDAAKKVTNTNFVMSDHFSFSWFSVVPQTAAYYIDDVKAGDYTFTMDDYFDTYIIDDTMRFLMVGNYTKTIFPYLGIGIGFTAALYNLKYCKGFTQGLEVDFVAPSVGVAIGYLYQPILGLQININKIPIQIEFSATSDKFFIKRNIKQESDSAIINRFMLTLGVGFTKIKIITAKK